LNNFQSHRPFCSLVKLRYVDGEQRHYFSSTELTNTCKWDRDVARRPYIRNTCTFNIRPPS
jgi:hypothetical protein